VSPARLKPSPDIVSAWEGLLERWVADAVMPLFVRESRLLRGSETAHHSGRMLVPVDNSPPQWLFRQLFEPTAPTYAERQATLDGNSIEVGMIVCAAEREVARYRAKCGDRGMNHLGWKLAHVQPVGRGNGNITTMPVEQLHGHFWRSMRPTNMVVVPRRWAGLAEVAAFLDALKAAW